MRRGLAGLVLSALAACSSGDDTNLMRIADLTKASLLGAPEAPPARDLTRAELDQIPYATISFARDGAPKAYLVPLAENGGYLNYLDQNRRGIVMFGGAIDGTQGLGHDLQAVRHDLGDPVARARPLAEWPASFYRDYQYRLRDGGEYSITLACVPVPVATETVVIAELSFEVVRVAETCTNAHRQVQNTYWVEAETGFIWKSEQWLGPELGRATVEIIRPFSG